MSSKGYGLHLQLIFHSSQAILYNIVIVHCVSFLVAVYYQTAVFLLLTCIVLALSLFLSINYIFQNKGVIVIESESIYFNGEKCVLENASLWFMCVLNIKLKVDNKILNIFLIPSMCADQSLWSKLILFLKMKTII